MLYFLPDFSSKAINIPYMKEIIKEDSLYLKVKNCYVCHVFVVKSFYFAEDLLDKLEEILIK